MTTEIQKYNFRQGLPLEFEIINFNQLFAKSANEITKPHRTEFYQILWFQHGEPTHLIDFNRIKIKANTLLFINKNSVQILDSQVSFNGKAILFTDNFFCKTESDTKFLRSSILFNDLLSIPQVNISETSSIFTDIFRQLEAELGYPKDNYQSDILCNHLRNLLLHAERERRKQDFIELKKDADLDYAILLKDLLDKHFISQKKVDFYCKQLYVTSKRLNKATKKIFGKTPKELIDDRVLLASKRLLAHTNETVNEIAFSLGFEEPTNFIKYFKKHTNKTPVEFRDHFASA